MRNRFQIAAILPALLILFTGCVKLPSESLEINRYTIQPKTEKLRTYEEPLPYSLQVVSFSSTSDQKSDRMNYRVGENNLNQYFYHRWSSSPEGILSDATARYLIESNLFRDGVLQEETGVVPTFELRGRLIELYHNSIKREHAAIFAIRLTLVYLEPGSFRRTTVMQKQYEFREEMEEPSIPVFVASVNGLVGQWLGKMTADLRSAVETFEPPPPLEDTVEEASSLKEQLQEPAEERESGL